MNAETSDFLFNRRDLKILPEVHVRNIPMCISYNARSFALEAFKDFDIGG
jgi:hypothetical protein